MSIRNATPYNCLYYDEPSHAPLLFACPCFDVVQGRSGAWRSPLRARSIAALRYFEPRRVGRVLDILGFLVRRLILTFAVIPRAPSVRQSNRQSDVYGCRLGQVQDNCELAPRNYFLTHRFSERVGGSPDVSPHGCQGFDVNCVVQGLLTLL